MIPVTNPLEHEERGASATNVGYQMRAPCVLGATPQGFESLILRHLDQVQRSSMPRLHLDTYHA
jgi:hypothetical protein